jgi:hypothetical protein
MKRGQASFEYLMVTAFLLMLMVPSIYLLYEHSTGAQTEISLMKVKDIGDKIQSGVESVYYLGEPAKTTLIVNFPEKIKDIRIARGGTIPNYIYELQFIMEDGKGDVDTTMVNVYENIEIRGFYLEEKSDGSGYDRKPIEKTESSADYPKSFEEFQTGSGKKKIVLTAESETSGSTVNDYVSILFE